MGTLSRSNWNLEMLEMLLFDCFLLSRQINDDDDDDDDDDDMYADAET